MKRLGLIAVLAVTLLALPAGPASAQRGAPDFRVVGTPFFVYAEGPGFTVLMTKDGVQTNIDDDEFGIPEAGFPIVRATQNLPPTVRAFECENGTYRVVSATFTTTSRGSASAVKLPRPAPYTPQFNARFPNIFTFVGIIEGTVVNEHGEQFKLYATDLAHEVITKDSFSSTNPIHAFIVDAEGNVRDTASLVGRVNIDVDGRAKHKIIDRGTCHQTANQNLGPGTDMVTVFGPFFVLPFNTRVVGD